MKNLNKVLSGLISDGHADNICVRVGRGRDIIFSEYKSRDGMIDSSTVFDMASVSKILSTTTIALIAFDKKLLSPDDLVSDYFECPPCHSTLTVKHLMTHTMGIGHKPVNLEGVTYDNVQNYILNIPLDEAVGEKVIYSCPAFILLGKILEKVFGERLDSLFDKYVAKPLNMKNSGYLPDKSLNIINHNFTDSDRGIVNDYNCRFLGGVAGNAGVFSTLDDMTEYALMLIEFGSPIISKSTFEMAIKRYCEGITDSRALGFLYVDDKYTQTGDLFPEGSIGHCGFAGQSVFLDLNSGLYVIVLSDATTTVTKKYGEVRYDIVMKMREDIHRAIKTDLQ